VSKTLSKRESYALLLISFWGFIVVGVPLGVLNVAWDHIHTGFGLPFDALGVLLLAGMIGRLIAGFTGGALMGWAGLGKYLLAGNVIAAVGLFGHALAPTWSLLVVAGLAAGFGGGMMITGLNTYVAARHTAAQVNWLNACFGLGQTLGPLVVLWVVLNAGRAWQWSFIVAAVLQVGSLAAVVLTARRWSLLSSDATEAAKERRYTARDTLRLSFVWVSIALFFVYGGTEVSTGQLTSTLFTAARGIDPKTASFWVSVYWGMLTVGRLLMGFVARYVKPATLLRLCILGAIIGTGLLWWNPMTGVAFAGLALTGLALAAVYPTLLSEGARRMGAAHTTNAVGFQVGASGLGSALLPGLAGWLTASLGLEIIGLFLVVACVVLGGLYELSLCTRITVAQNLNH